MGVLGFDDDGTDSVALMQADSVRGQRENGGHTDAIPMNRVPTLQERNRLLQLRLQQQNLQMET